MRRFDRGCSKNRAPGGACASPAIRTQAADFIWWMQTSGFFARMLEGNLDRKVQDEESRLLGPDGVSEFWDLATAA